MEKTKILSLWQSLEESNELGLVKKLYEASLPIIIYATYQCIDKIYGIGFSVPDSIKYDLSPFKKLGELDIKSLKDNSLSGYKILLIQLKDKENLNVFSALCEDLIRNIKPYQDSSTIIYGVVNQIIRWNNLFKKKGNGLLSGTEQQGLYGELCFLKKRLCFSDEKQNLYKIVESWTGQEKTNKDFQGTNWAVEVKSSSSNNPQRITINGERQLDNTIVENLFLYHLTLECSKMSGQSLTSLIEEVKKKLSKEVAALYLFEAKLLEAGYKEEDKTAYESRLYAIRKENLYKVSDNFPRIMEKELRKGVCEVTYSVILAICDDYLVPENTVLFKISQNE